MSRQSPENKRNNGRLMTRSQASRLASLIALCALPFSTAAATPLQLSTFAPKDALASLVYPIMGPRMSSDFGIRKHPIRKSRQHHHGIDLAAPRGAFIRSIAAGQVIYADPFGGYGRVVVVKHANGLTSHYGHCDTLKVSIGNQVKAGDILGTVGSSGLSTGPHLHFEIRKYGKPQDPERYLPGLATPAKG